MRENLIGFAAPLLVLALASAAAHYALAGAMAYGRIYCAMMALVMVVRLATHHLGGGD